MSLHSYMLKKIFQNRKKIASRRRLGKSCWHLQKLIAFRIFFKQIVLLVLNQQELPETSTKVMSDFHYTNIKCWHFLTLTITEAVTIIVRAKFGWPTELKLDFCLMLAVKTKIKNSADPI